MSFSLDNLRTVHQSHQQDLLDHSGAGQSNNQKSQNIDTESMYLSKLYRQVGLLVSVLASRSSAPDTSPGWEQFTITGCVQIGNSEFHTEGGGGNPVMD